MLNAKHYPYLKTGGPAHSSEHDRDHIKPNTLRTRNYRHTSRRTHEGEVCDGSSYINLLPYLTTHFHAVHYHQDQEEYDKKFENKKEVKI